MAGEFSVAPQNPLLEIQLFAWSGVLLGFVMAALAGPVARLLTFDAEPRGTMTDSGDRLTRR